VILFTRNRFCIRPGTGRNNFPYKAFSQEKQIQMLGPGYVQQVSSRTDSVHDIGHDFFSDSKYGAQPGGLLLGNTAAGSSFNDGPAPSFVHRV
jgi:hypothetical protein